MQAKSITFEQSMAAQKALLEQQDSAVQGEIESIVRTAHPAYHGGTISFARQGCRTSVTDRKVDELSRNYKSAMDFLKKSGRGLSQRPMEGIRKP
jgi:hypothetical protein